MRIGTRLDLENPRTFNAKLQWLKLNYYDPAQAEQVDKHAAKAWVAEIVGNEYVIPTIAVFDTVDEIDFECLPESCVIKTTHDSGGVVIVKDKNSLDVDAAREKLGRSLANNYYFNGREPQYKDIVPRIIVEPLIVDSVDGQLRDYKFFCFDGEVKALFVASDRQEGQVKFDYFDESFTLLPMRQDYLNATVTPSKPERFKEMVEISEKLSAGYPQMRVDLYEANGKIYFGEMTFYHFGGLHRFFPAKWDRLWGDWITLPDPIRR